MRIVLMAKIIGGDLWLCERIRFSKVLVLLNNWKENGGADGI